MTVGALLAELRSRDIQIWVDGDQLRCNAPLGVLTPDLRDVLKQRKNDMIEFLLSAELLAKQSRAIVPLQAKGSRAPIFGVPGHNGDVFLYRPLARELGSDQPFFGLQPPGVDEGTEPLDRLESIAAYFVAQILEFRPNAPFVLMGYCAGATIAFEIARQLLDRGSRVEQVIFFAGAYPTWYRPLWQFIEHAGLRFKRIRQHIAAGDLIDAWRRYRDHETEIDPIAGRRERLKKITAEAVRNYQPANIAAPVVQILPSPSCAIPRRAISPWRSIVPHLQELYGPEGCEGDVMLLDPHVRAIAEVLRTIS